MSIIGEAVLGCLVDKVISSSIKYATKNLFEASDLQKCQKMFKDIATVLDNAEHKRFTSPLVREWLQDLEDLLYDAEDILECFNYKVLRRKVVEQSQASSSSFQVIIGKIKEKLPKVSSKIRDIVERLEVMSERKRQLDLFAHNLIVSNPSSSEGSRVTGPLPTEHRLYGRETEKNTIIEFLLKRESQIGVIPIVGMGGLGKSTLAQYTLNDSRVVGHFDERAWIHVSKLYDETRITKAILEAVTLRACEFTDPSLIQLRLSDSLKNKKICVVLDDIWNNNYDDWVHLLAPLKSGAAGSKIIVTTRNTDIADMVKTVCYEPLKPLSNEDSWKVFCEHSGFDPHEMSGSIYEEIGRRIVGKCAGLPLAAKSIGGVLRYKNTEEKWEAVLSGIVSNTDEREDQIMAILRTSYLDLPSNLKRCFAFCALFPENHKLVEGEVVPLWMGLDLIQNENAEEAGRNYFQQLIARSMLLPAGSLYSDMPSRIQQNASQMSTGCPMETTCFCMHDLYRDLATQICGQPRYHMSNTSHHLPDTMRRTRHLSFSNSTLISVVDELLSLETQETLPLRSFIPFLSSPEIELLCQGIFLPHSLIEYNLLSNLFLKMKYLRVLCLRGYGNSELPESIGNLRLLRYLDFSGSRIVRLPKATTSLYNLEILILRFCTMLQELPTDIGNLINLCYLDITKSSSVQELPEGVKKLTRLRRLSDFVIDEGRGLSMACLEKMKFLQGELRIRGLANVSSSEDATLARLSEKNLKGLELIGSPQGVDGAIDLAVLEELRPHQHLRKLFLLNYLGPSCFPSWCDPSWLVHLTHLGLYGCDNVTALPFMGSFPFLEYISVGNMPALRQVGLQWYGTSNNSSFARLSELEFYNLNGWEEWTRCDQAHFSRLRRLMIRDCNQLVGDSSVLKAMPSLEDLEISRCQNLSIVVPRLPRLKKLTISICKSVTCTEEFDLGTVEIFRLSLKPFIEVAGRYAPNLAYPSRLFASPLFLNKIRCGWTRVRFLAIDDHFFSRKYARHTSTPSWVLEGCLVDFQQQQEMELENLELTWQLFEHLPPWIFSAQSLASIKISTCPCLTTLSPSGDFPARLSSLEVVTCWELASLSETGNLAAGLERLVIGDCPSLRSFVMCDSGVVPDLKHFEIGEGCPLMIQKFPDFAHKFNSLSHLAVTGCTPNALEAICKWLPNLTQLRLSSCPGIVTFPSVERREVGLRSLNDLRLIDFPDLKRVSFTGEFGCLAKIGLAKCPELDQLFEEELAHSIRFMAFGFCPKIAQQLISGGAQLRQKISHIQCMLDNQLVSFVK